MANVMRWRYGDTRPVLAPVGGGTVVEIGDLVMLSSGSASPAASLPDTGTKAANQEAFHDVFLGVAMQSSTEEDTAPIRVATAGVFEFDCPSATCNVGDLFGADENAGGTELLAQTATKVAACNLAIGRCVKRLAAAGTKVLVEIESTVMRGGPQVMA